MNRSPFSHSLQRQQGATMIVVVLLTMFVLLAVLFITMNLTLGARQTTTDQSQQIPAQFAAESGMAAAQAQLRVFREIVPALSAQEGNPALTDEDLVTNKANIPNISPAHKRGLNMRFNDVINKLSLMCGDNEINDISSAGIALGTFTHRGVQVENIAPVCEFSRDSKALAGDQLDLFKELFLSINPDSVAGANLEKKYNHNGLIAENDRERFLQAIFGNAIERNIGGDGAKAKVSSGIRPVALVRGQPEGGDPRTSTSQTTYPYYFLFQINDIDSVGSNQTSQRRQVMSNTNNMYALKMEFEFFGIQQDKPETKTSFSIFAMFVNDASSLNQAPFGRDTFIKGRMHTNTYWRTRTYNNTPGFYDGTGFIVDGKMTSTGCSELSSDGTECIGNIMARLDDADESTGRNPTGGLITNAGYAGTDGYDYYGSPNEVMVRVVRGNEAPDFTSEAIPLPQNANDQLEDAKNSGIYIPSSVGQLDFSVSRENGQDIQNIYFSSGNRGCYLKIVPEVKGDERIERVKVWGGRGYVDARRDTNHPCGFTPDGDGTTIYNGNLYVDGEVGALTSMSGGMSNNGRYSIANDMKTTLTATGDIRIRDSITYENHTDSNSALGLYSSRGDINFRFDSVPDLKLDAFVMAPKGSMSLDNLFNAANKGSLEHYGGRILDNAGGGVATGDGRGYSGQRQYIYDDREVVPRGFPTYTEEEVAGEIIPDGNPYLIRFNAGFFNSGDLSTPDNGFENNGEIRQVGVQ